LNLRNNAHLIFHREHFSDPGPEHRLFIGYDQFEHGSQLTAHKFITIDDASYAVAVFAVLGFVDPYHGATAVQLDVVTAARDFSRQSDFERDLRADVKIRARPQINTSNTEIIGSSLKQVCRIRLFYDNRKPQIESLPSSRFGHETSFGYS
jgi:hypothetical protein